jgi:hypothetical protein
MQKQFTVTVYSDPSHAWAKVKRSVLTNLKIADKVSSFSYQRGDYAYLEEDADFPLLIAALQQHNTRIKCVEKHTDKESRVRSYERYSV